MATGLATGLARGHGLRHFGWPVPNEIYTPGPLNWREAINRDLVFAFDGKRDVASGMAVTLQSNATKVADPVTGTAVALDGSGDRILVTHDAKLVGMNTFTLSAWVYKASKDIKPFGKWASGTGGFILREISSVLQGYAGENTGGSFSFGSLPGWHQYTMVCQNDTLTLYRDGIADATTVMISGAVPAITNTLYIGSEYDSLDEQDGRIAWPRIWRRALSPAEAWSLWAPQTRWQMLRIRTGKRRTLPIVSTPSGYLTRRWPWDIGRAGSRSALTC